MAVTPRRRALVLAAFAAVPLLALAITAVRYTAFRAAADGSGTHGTAVVERAHVSGGGDEVCTGAFTPDGGGPATEVDIEVDGPCTEGERLDAFLVEPAALYAGWGRPTAWTAGTGTGEHLAPVIVVFVFLVLPVLLAALVFRRRRPR
ncbi:hypothetical protein [Glycomyces terrestris]|uniref:DUF3592 domain-containing protein n=1 Tax=Glycomyces terrestris TaxID=2493553 RepID=A0A426UY22_9ACTN|nr:hypothetical protein [Glycomyces terrestris]RRR99461.1 hypothetical protein EIW28_12195 [Glycomyces terrestris]